MLDMNDLGRMNDQDLDRLVNVAAKERAQRMARSRESESVQACGSSPIRDIYGSSPIRGIDAMSLAGEAGPLMSPPPSALSLDNIVSVFTFHPWNNHQVEAGAQVVEALIAAAKVILRVVPAGPDRTVALRKLREARMDANSAITHQGRF